MESRGEPERTKEWIRRALERGREAEPVMEWVMCSTCCGFVWRKKRSAVPNPGPDEVEEMVADVRTMRAVMAKPRPLDEEQPDALTRNQREILRLRRMVMMKHKMCPTCYRSLSDTPQPKPYMEIGADAGSKKMVAGDRTMATDAESNKKNKRSKKNNRSKEEPRGGKKKKMVADLGSREDSEYSMRLTGKSSSEYSMGRTGKRRTKMVTCRLSKEFIETFPPARPFTYNTDHPLVQMIHARKIAEYEVKCQLQACWLSQCAIKGYGEYQEEVTEDEDDDNVAVMSLLNLHE